MLKRKIFPKRFNVSPNQISKHDYLFVITSQVNLSQINMIHPLKNNYHNPAANQKNNYFGGLILFPRSITSTQNNQSKMKTFVRTFLCLQKQTTYFNKKK